MTIPMDAATLTQMISQSVAMGVREVMKDSVAGPRERFKHDLPGGFTTTTNLMHGPYGIFGGAGLDQDVFSTRMTPRGLLSVLPAFPAIDTNPIVPYLTAITDEESGSEQDYPCDDPLEAGQLESCRLGAEFGRIERSTSPIDIDEIGKRVNRGEFFDLRLVNEPLLSGGNFGVPGVPTELGQVLNREVLARFLTLGAAFEQKLGVMNWTGNPANNTTHKGYKEYKGLQSLISNTIVDVLNSTACPSLYSDIKNANYTQVEAAGGADIIFQIMTMVYRFVLHNAMQMRFDPVKWAWVMKGDLFNQLCDYWPCVYNTSRCFTSGGSTNGATVDGVAMKQFADEMRNGKFLRVDGVDIPVIIDDFIPEKTNTTGPSQVTSGKYASDIYLLPLTVTGGRVVTFFEYFNYDATNGVRQAIQDGFLGPTTRTSDGGRFAWVINQTNYCFKWLAKIEPRLRLLTPHLAGRIQNVMYAPLQHLRSGVVDDPYFVHGGNTTLSNNPY